MTKRLWWIIGAMLSVLALALSVWWFWGRPQDPLKVKAGVVAPISMQEDVYATGSVVPVSRQEVRVLTPGRVEKVAVKVGDAVQVGQILVALDTTLADAQVAQARVGVEAAQAVVNTAQANLDELKKAQSAAKSATESFNVAGKGPDGADAEDGVSSLLPDFISEQKNSVQESLVSPAVIAQAEGALAQSKVALKQAQEILKVAQVQKGQLVHKAGMAGTVLEVNAQEGNLTSVQLPLVVVADLSEMNVEAQLNEVDAGKIRLGGKVTISSKMLGEQSVQGTIVEIAPTAVSKPSIQGSSSPTVGVKIRLEKAPLELKPGFTVTVEIVVATKEGVLAVPQEALFQEGNKNYVYKIQAGRLEKTEVTIGIGNDTHQEITSGLTAGDKVVLDPSTDFSEGMLVTPEAGSGVS
ncbi:efflux RND transporter periplasmic adaptor subunit [Desulfosporosinus sp.]|uniref:efflux RND transporter periplasmic adaptor subunit n=1 Tax=Desulfosporosinus sp. TaxID=157907 RepID=UPI0025BEADD9|nr:efflux RND transporter periplasmic adaptor subunit [Desulfosporosinus sp.]MBC2721130.1 efflux RND transporter periplasmic adaptor subunit [Desulfosporosinus sp.]MBC2725547.1 efflux RND transporter periplasmic adaptor subunit [Desulfosporosinus sp.]